MKEILEYALERLEDACRNGEACDVQFWSGYADGVRACMRGLKNESFGRLRRIPGCDHRIAEAGS